MGEGERCRGGGIGLRTRVDSSGDVGFPHCRIFTGPSRLGEGDLRRLRGGDRGERALRGGGDSDRSRSYGPREDDLDRDIDRRCRLEIIERAGETSRCRLKSPPLIDGGPRFAGGDGEWL